jgi:hypothetical protein
MIKFDPFRIIINGNRRDDMYFELWELEGKDPKRTPRNLDDIELQPSLGHAARLYEQTVFSLLLRIGRSKIGRVVLAASFELGHDFYILPLGERDTAIRMAPFGLFESCIESLVYTRPENKSQKATRVLFTPYKPNSCTKALNMGPPDSALLHELVHAVRPRREAKLKQKSTNDAWSDLEEFFALVIENIYRAERGDKDLQAGSDGSVLSADRSTSEGFLQDKTIRNRVEDAFDREELARKLARYPEISFNPFAAIANERNNKHGHHRLHQHH